MDFDNFIISKKTDRRGEERGELAKKSNNCLPIIYRGVKKSGCYFPNIEDGKVAKTATVAYN
jgi:hypothetical protein